MDEKTCEKCGETFFEEDAEEIFSISFFSRYDYSSINSCLCGDCAVEYIEDVISNEEPGILSVCCENCGKQFDPFLEDSEFRSHSKLDIGLQDLSKTLCCDCGLEQELTDFPTEEELDEDNLI